MNTACLYGIMSYEIMLRITTSILILSNTTLVKRYIDAYSSNEKLKYHIPIDSCRGYPSYGRAYEDYKPEYWTLQCHTFVAAVIMQQMEIVSWYLRYPFSISTPAYSMSLYIYIQYIYTAYIFRNEIYIYIYVKKWNSIYSFQTKLYKFHTLFVSVICNTNSKYNNIDVLLS